MKRNKLTYRFGRRVFPDASETFHPLAVSLIAQPRENNEPPSHRKGNPLAPVLVERIEAQIQVTAADRLPF